MTRIKFLLAAALSAAIVVPAASAQTVHYVGAGSSAQWQEAALGTYALAQGLVTGSKCSYHYTAKNNNSDLNPAAELIDPRNSSIAKEPGNIWIVWIGDCSSTGTTGVTDIWADISVDSTVGNRAFFAAYKSGTASIQGVQLSVDTSTPTSTNAIAQALWSDDTTDQPLASAVASAINTGGVGGNPVNVNVGLTDIRPEDALYATFRSLSAYNANGNGLGYDHGPAKGIGNSIESYVTASAVANPVEFYMVGKDPLSKATISSYATIPVGAAPVIYIMNNGGTSPIATDLEDDQGSSSVTLGQLLDGTEPCSSSSAAFGSTGVGSKPLVVFLREPLSGTMNTNEFSEIRTSLNPTDTQEKGITSTTVAPYNPLHLPCSGNVGYRERAVGTGDVVTGVLNASDSLGYIFFGFGNIGSIAANPKYNYLTLDGIDPIFSTAGSYSTCQGGGTGANTGQVCQSNAQCTLGGTCTPLTGTNAQELPKCGVPYCNTASVWGSGLSFPNLRNGTYRDWSLYRWVGSPSSPHFCQNNLSSNPITACQAITASPTEASYSNGTGEATLHFSSAPAATVGESLVVSGYANHVSGTHHYNDSDYNGTYTVLKATTTEIVYQLAAGLGLSTDTTDPGSATVAPPADAYGIEAIAQATQNAVDSGVTDFVPFNPTVGSDGMNVYRSHRNTPATYAGQTFTGNNGPLVQSGTNSTHGGGSEAGSDVGGCIEVGDTSANGTLDCQQN
jgi:hypothetical protein